MKLSRFLKKRGRIALIFSFLLVILPSLSYQTAGLRNAGALILPSNANNLSAAVIDSANGFAYFGTSEGVVPAMILKIRLTDLTLAATLPLNPGEFSVGAAVMDSNGFAYFGIRAPSFPPVSPGSVVKVRLSDFARVGTLNLTNVPGGAYIQSAVIDSHNGLAYFGGDGIIARVRLSDLALNGTLTLPPPANGGLTSAIIDPGNGFAYFGVASAPGVVVRVNLSSFTLAGFLTLNLSEAGLTSAVIDTARGFAYFGTNPFGPASIVRIRLSNFTRVDALNLTTGEDGLPTAVIDEKNGFAYFGTYGNREQPICCGPATIIQVRLSNFTRAGSIVLATGETALGAAVIDQVNGFAYFGTLTRPGIVVKVQLSSPSSLRASDSITDDSGNPIRTDAKGVPMVDVIINHGKVTATNPGELLAWANITNTGDVPVASLKLNETLPQDWKVRQSLTQYSGPINVFVRLSNNITIDVTNQTSMAIFGVNPETISVVINDMGETRAGELNPGQSLLVSAKIGYGLLHSSQPASTYPRNYTATSVVIGWTEPSFQGNDVSATASTLFIAYAKTTSQANKGELIAAGGDRYQPWPWGPASYSRIGMNLMIFIAEFGLVALSLALFGYFQRRRKKAPYQYG